MDLRPTTPEACAACDARTLSICAALPHPELRRLADCAWIGEFERGEVLAREGEPRRHVFTITDGAAMMSTLLSDGRRQVLGFLFKGDFVGLSGGHQHDFTLTALTPVQACRFDRSRFRRLLHETPCLEEELLSRACDALTAARQHATLLGRSTAQERVCSLLLTLADRGAESGEPADLAPLPMTRADMADYLGLTTETVSRTLTQLRERGAIELLGLRAVRLKTRAALAALSGG